MRQSLQVIVPIGIECLRGNSQVEMAVKPGKKQKQTIPSASRGLLTQLAAMPEQLKRADFRQQYAALCFRCFPDRDDIEILVITSRETGRWIIPKGWPMKKKKPYEAAALEAFQESGVRGRVGKRAVGRYTYLKWLDNQHVSPCIVEVFPMDVTEQKADYKEQGQRKLAWVSPDEAARRVREVELKSLLVHFRPKRKKISGE